MAKQKDLKSKVEQEIAKMLDSSEEPSEGRMKLLQLGIKMCALNAKLEESEYGDFFNPGEPSSIQKRPGTESATGKRANGGGLDA